MFDQGKLLLKRTQPSPVQSNGPENGEKFLTFEIEHAPRNENRFADALAALGSQIMFEGDNTRVEISKREESIIEVLKERFQEE